MNTAPTATKASTPPEDWRFLPETKSNRAEITTANAMQVAQVFGDDRFQREQRGRLMAAAPQMLKKLVEYASAFPDEEALAIISAAEGSAK